MTIVNLALPATRRHTRPRSSTASSDPMMALIERLSVAPDVEVNNLDRLLAHQDQVFRDKARAAFGAAFTSLQLTLPIVAEKGEIRDRRGDLQRTYALWEDINEEIKPVLSEHGFALWFRVENDHARVAITGVLGHLGGHHIESTLSLPVDLTGSKNAVQAIGSSTSYGKRYVACALLNITSRGGDDDALTTLATVECISAGQVEDIRLLLRQGGHGEGPLLTYLGLDNLADLSVDRFARTIEAIKLRRKA